MPSHSRPCLRCLQEDELEVFAYRSALSLVATCYGAATAAALAPNAGWAEAIAAHGTVLAALGGLSMGAATVLIHVYLDPLKKALQVLAAAGLVGGAYLAVSHPELPLPAYVAQHPQAVWLVGPSFAALTGIAVKEGFCFGQRESYLLTFLVPSLLLGHLTGLLPGEAKAALAAATAALLAVFAARKFTQPVRDDIGGGQGGGDGCQPALLCLRAKPQRAAANRVFKPCPATSV